MPPGRLVCLCLCLFPEFRVPNPGRSGFYTVYVPAVVEPPLPVRPFQHLTTVEEQLACLGCLHRHLRENGKLILDIFNPMLEALVKVRAGWCELGFNHVEPKGLPRQELRKWRLLSAAT